MCWSASVSLNARPRSSGVFCRIDDGSVWPISSVRLFAPTLSSIAWMSRGEGPICRRTKSVAASAVVLSGAFMGASLEYANSVSSSAKADDPVRRDIGD
jgi:hypothetical protein